MLNSIFWIYFCKSWSDRISLVSDASYWEDNFRHQRTCMCFWFTLRILPLRILSSESCSNISLNWIFVQNTNSGWPILACKVNSSKWKGTQSEAKKPPMDFFHFHSLKFSFSVLRVACKLCLRKILLMLFWLADNNACHTFNTC